MLKKFFVAFTTAIFFMCMVSGVGETAEKKVSDKKSSATSKPIEKKSVWQPEIRVGILSGVTSVNLQVSVPCVMIDTTTKKVLQKISAEKNFAIDFAALKSNAVEIRGEEVQLKDLQTTINGKKYFGGVRVNKKNGSLTVINLAPVEEYLRGVLPQEMPVSWSVEALKAQAVAARTFVLKNRNRHAADGYDFCPTTHCQVYEGANFATTSDKAILDTRGVVLFYGGKICDAPFHTDSGGMTENVADVWGTHLPYLQASEELNKQTQAWTQKFMAKDFSERMGDNFGELKSISLSKLVIGKSASDRSASGRVKFALIVGKNRTVKISGIDLRAKFSLPGTLFDMKFENGEVIFEGYGRGHGVGMSQYGAEAYAKSGLTYDKILSKYYHGTELKKLY